MCHLLNIFNVIMCLNRVNLRQGATRNFSQKFLHPTTPNCLITPGINLRNGTKGSWRIAPTGSYPRNILLKSTAKYFPGEMRRNLQSTCLGHLTLIEVEPSTSGSSCWPCMWPLVELRRRKSDGPSECTTSTEMGW